MGALVVAGALVDMHYCDCSVSYGHTVVDTNDGLGWGCAGAQLEGLAAGV